MRPGPALRLAAYGLAAAFTALIGWRAFIYHPPLVTAAQVKPSRPAARTLPVQTVTQSALILELFNPTGEDITRQHNESTLKRQIEEAMVIGFMLEHCGMIGSSDYYDTYRALIAYAASTGLAADTQAASTLVQALASSAGSSYALLYARTPCDEPGLTDTAEKLARWRNAILQPAPPR